MTQQFKSIYFHDYPGEQASEKNVTLAFGKKDASLYDTVQTLSSHELRELIGYHRYTDLKEAAERQKLSINKFCLEVLRERVNGPVRPADQPFIPGLIDSTEFDVDPIQTTFRGGEAEPLHLWYPYLEGYSPQFVEAIISHYAPNGMCQQV